MLSAYILEGKHYNKSLKNNDYKYFKAFFVSRILESGFFSGCPVFQKVHIWNLHVIGNLRMQKFSRTNLSGIRFCPETVIFSHFLNFIMYVHPKQLVTNVFMSLTFPGCWNPDFL